MPCPIGDDLDLAASILQRGGLVAIPTETVYGLAANALDGAAVAKIFAVKNRPAFDPLIVHLADASWLPRVVSAVPRLAHRLIERFWPGPLSLVLEKAASVPDLVTSGLPTVGVRVPAHPTALQLLQRAGLPLAAPSANLFGRISPTTAVHVRDSLGDRIDYIMDGGPCEVGVESTVLDLSQGRPRLLRPGGLPIEQIEELIGTVERWKPASDDASAQPAPGLLGSHYAPRTPLQVIPLGSAERHARRTGLLAFQPEPLAHRFAVVEILSEGGDLAEAAGNLFAAMRRLDAAELDLIIARPAPEFGLGRAINDRLRRAALGSGDS